MSHVPASRPRPDTPATGRLRRRLTAGRAKVVAAAVVIFLGGGAGGVTLAHGVPSDGSGSSGGGSAGSSGA